MEEDLDKVIQTINSCSDFGHLETARNMIFLFLKRFEDDEVSYTNYYNKLFHHYEIRKYELSNITD